jgi:hypothetical protein
MNKRQIRKSFHRAIDTHTRGMFRDRYWTPIHAVFKEMESLGSPVSLVSSEYQLEDGVPVRKVWRGEIAADDGMVYFTMTAAGAGSVHEPLEVYDVVGYAT